MQTHHQKVRGRKERQVERRSRVKNEKIQMRRENKNEKPTKVSEERTQRPSTSKEERIQKRKENEREMIATQNERQTETEMPVAEEGIGEERRRVTPKRKNIRTMMQYSEGVEIEKRIAKMKNVIRVKISGQRVQRRF
uniref:Uncharacterized protein n=1 Tax=Octopus bimaculoides TaxID=37653 RepID=A0A0L8I767_OCTBM